MVLRVRRNLVRNVGVLAALAVMIYCGYVWFEVAKYPNWLVVASCEGVSYKTNEARILPLSGVAACGHRLIRGKKIFVDSDSPIFLDEFSHQVDTLDDLSNQYFLCLHRIPLGFTKVDRSVCAQTLVDSLHWILTQHEVSTLGGGLLEAGHVEGCTPFHVAMDWPDRELWDVAVAAGMDPAVKPKLQCSEFNVRHHLPVFESFAPAETGRLKREHELACHPEFQADKN